MERELTTLQQIMGVLHYEEEMGILFAEDIVPEEKIPYSQIYNKSLKYLGYLQKNGLRKGDKLIFQIESNYLFVHMLWACCLGGIVAVPASCDSKASIKQKVIEICYKCDQCFMVSSDDRKKELEEESKTYNEQAFEQVTFLDLEEMETYEEDGNVIEVDSKDILFIQFSSGSTSKPKGVIITNRNFMSNAYSVGRKVKLTRGDVIVSWMPLTHDMGMIGGHLLPALYKFNQCLLPAKTFMANPLTWIERIEKYKATFIVTSDFSLQYVMKYLYTHPDYKISWKSVKTILNGSEQISVKNTIQFIKFMKNYDLKETAMFPVYGMAEASLAVAFPKEGILLDYVTIDMNHVRIGEKVSYLSDINDHSGLSYVSVGKAMDCLEMRISDDKENDLGTDVFGLIEIRGACVMQGYYEDENADKEAFTSDGWLRTGDLGFIHNENLYILGRYKNVIIINGYNYIATDIEKICLSIPGVSAGNIAACSILDKKSDKEKLGIFITGDQLSKEEKHEISMQVRRNIMRDIGIYVEYIEFVPKMATTDSGKIKRYLMKQEFEKKLMQLESAEAEDSNDVQMEEQLLTLFKEMFGEQDVTLESCIHPEGISSIMISGIYTKLDALYPNTILIEDLFRFNTVGELADKIRESRISRESDKKEQIEEKTASDKIAIIGMDCRFPGANSVEEYWENLCNEVESVGNIPNERASKIKEQLEAMEIQENVQYLMGGYLDNLERFDNAFFEIINREAIAMSPAQRLFMEVGYHAMEDAGYGGSALYGSKTGVFAGYISDLDAQNYQSIIAMSKDKSTPTGALSSNLCGRFSYFMNFSGPSMIVDTACSSSIAALNVACKSIKSGECRQALVGGVQIDLKPYRNQKIGIESENGHLRPFDNNADGTCTGEGVAVILIKGYEEALKDGDHIYGVIDGIGINQDGRSIGLSAPNPDAQKNLITETLRRAGRTVDDITYIEAHGTGTELGDPIEMNVLAEVFRKNRTVKEENLCAVGSVKSNIGHLYAASGLASVIKCCCMFEHKKIPATINFEQINEKIKWSDSGLFINKKMMDWDNTQGKRYCGISNFGFSGTNCYVILEEPDKRTREEKESYYPFVISSNSSDKLKDMVQEYIHYLERGAEAQYRDICFTGAFGRKHERFRLAVNANSKQDLLQKLHQYKGITDISHEIFVGSNEVLSVNEQSQIEKACICYCELAKQDEEKQEIMSEHLCELYVEGITPKWKLLFEDTDAVRVSLPLYKYEENVLQLVF